tara:strand:- start:776 stop:988 length:213 start_codon:yes stop_codon:yes gene_type:complete
MAVTINMEFTDGQWELIKKYYPLQPNEDGSMPSEATAELIGKWGKMQIQRYVVKFMEDEAVTNARKAFDV